MKRISIAITVADNGGMTMFGPLSLATQTAAKNNDHSKQRMYISPTMDPLTVGSNLLAMLADLAMTEKPSIFDDGSPKQPSTNDDPLF